MVTRHLAQSFATWSLGKSAVEQTTTPTSAHTVPSHPEAASTSFSRREICTSGGVRFAGLQRAGMLDWPGKLATTVFLAGCNLRCPYCHNPELIGTPRRLLDESALWDAIEGRESWLDGVVISGGEPTRSDGLEDLCRRLKSRGLAIKLDSNGTYPEILARLIAEQLVDFVALDVKSTPDKYERACGVREIWPLVDRSIDTIIHSGIDHEFRTTCYPLAVGPEDLPRIASRLRGGRRYVLQQYRPSRTLDPAATSVRPLSADTLRRSAVMCSAFLPTTLRGT